MNSHIDRIFNVITILLVCKLGGTYIVITMQFLVQTKMELQRLDCNFRGNYAVIFLGNYNANFAITV